MQQIFNLYKILQVYECQFVSFIHSLMKHAYWKFVINRIHLLKLLVYPLNIAKVLKQVAVATLEVIL